METNENKKHLSENGGGQLHIALCFDGALASYAETLLFSLSDCHPKHQIDVHIVYRELSSSSIQALRKVEETLPNLLLHFYLIDGKVLNSVLADDYHLPVESYFRFFLPTLLPRVNRLLYLDIDILVCGDLSSLWTMELSGNCIGAVLEQEMGIYFPENLSALGLSSEQYFNSGVLLMDLERMRQEKVSESLIALAKQRGQTMRFGDQDILNLYFKDKVTYLPQSYNYRNYAMHTGSESIEDVHILHFNGPGKPWFTVVEGRERYQNFVASYQNTQRACQQSLKRQEQAITVVVSARAVEQLEACLRSICHQRVPYLEVVVLDYQGNSAIQQLAAHIGEIYQLRVLYLPTLGVTEQQATALAFSVATGAYLLFVEGSDYLEQAMLETLHQVALEHESKIVIADYCTLDLQRGVYIFPNRSPEPISRLSWEEAFVRQVEPIFSKMWGILIKRELLEKQAFLWQIPLSEMTILRRLYQESGYIYYLNGTYFCHRVGAEESAQEKLAKIADFQELLAELTILGLDTVTIGRLLHREYQEVASGDNHQSVYFKQLLTLLTEKTNY